MGSYTTVVDSDVRIMDMDGLKRFLLECKEKKLAYDAVDCASAVKILNNQVDFSGMDGWKIISYWYDDMVAFLRDIATFVEGIVYLEFENQDEGGQIEFEDGQCLIHFGHMEWTKETADAFLSNDSYRGTAEERRKNTAQQHWIAERVLARRV